MDADNRDVKHVLVVDDYPDTAALLCLLVAQLSPHRVTTDVGFNGVQAVELARAHRPDVAILDIDMPLMNGIDAARAIRAALPAAPPLLVAMTGNPRNAAAPDTRQVFDRVLTKPVNVDELIDVLTHSTADDSAWPR